MVDRRFLHPLKTQPYALHAQSGWILGGFGQMILGFSLIALILFLLASTSFLSDFILNNMLKLPVVVNPIAAASHQSAQYNLQNEAISDVSVTDIESPQRTIQDTQQDKKRALASQVEPSSANNSSTEASAIERVTDNIPDNILDLVALTPRLVWDSNNQAGAQAIVVLGGGLTRDKSGKITPNLYTRSRLMQAISQHHSTGLPIFLTGVESRYMQEFLQEHGVSAQWLESRSMNTCENARFSALLLQRLGGAPKVELVTDQWHIPRARWLFAMNGIETVPVPAALPGDPVPWWPDARNLTHTRRAVYELVAFTRDRWFGVVGCREVP